MDTLQILQAINDKGISASFFTGPSYVYGCKWKTSLSTRTADNTIVQEATVTGDSFEETLRTAWETLTRKGAI